MNPVPMIDIFTMNLPDSGSQRARVRLVTVDAVIGRRPAWSSGVGEGVTPPTYPDSRPERRAAGQVASSRRPKRGERK